MLQLVLVVWVLGVGGLASAGGWEVAAREAGVLVERKDLDGYDLPVVRGTGLIKAGIFDVLAVLDDIDHYVEWMHACSASGALKVITPYERIVYNRTAMPWPINDRDAVLVTKIAVDRQRKTVRASFDAVSSELKPEVSGVVRMPMVRGFYLLEWVDASTTRVTYQAHADPGGLIPDFIVASESVEIPLKVIVSLRRQVVRRRGSYKRFLKIWDPAYGGVGFEGAQTGR